MIKIVKKLIKANNLTKVILNSSIYMFTCLHFYYKNPRLFTKVLHNLQLQSLK